MLKLGTKSIKNLHLGNKNISKSYLGDKLVFNNVSKPYYCEVEYLESTGTQWIDTNISPTNKTKWEIKFAFTKDVTGQLMGAGHAGDYRFNIGIESNKFRFAIGSGWTTLAETKDTNIHTWVLNSENSSCSLDDITVFSTYSSNFSTTDYHIVLCNRAVGSNYCSTKIYSSKIYTDNILIRDFIPVLDLNMKPCLYDKVSGEFFYNQGTGEFLYGRQIHEVEYLESTGEQYIETGYNICTETDEAELDYQLLDETVYKWLFGEHDNNARFALGSGDGTNKRNLAYGSNTIRLTDSYFFNNKHSFKANKDGIFVDGVKFADYKSFTSTSSIWLFGLNLSPYTYGSKTRIWGYRHKRNGSLIRDCVPAVDENGKGFMFDKVTRSIYDNAGTGEFLYDKKYTELEYLESTGTQYIDTGIYLTNNHSVEIEFQLTSIPQYRTGIFGGLINSGDDNKKGRYGRLTKASTVSNAGYFEDGYGKTNIYAVDRNPTLERYLFKQEKNKVYVNGVLINTFSEATFTMGETAPLGLFKYTNYTPALAKYYASKWWDGDELVRDFIPVLDLNNKPCMYDKITKQFFYNQGTGEFLYNKV